MPMPSAAPTRSLPGFLGTTSLSATPLRPACPSRASGRSSLITPWGFPCCARFPCVHAAATTPVQRPGVFLAHLTQPSQPSPEGSPGRPAHRPFRDPMTCCGWRFRIKVRIATVHFGADYEHRDWQIRTIDRDPYRSWCNFRFVGIEPLELADHLTVARRWGKDVKAFCSRRRFHRANGALRTTSGEGEAADGSKLSDHRCTGGRSRWVLDSPGAPERRHRKLTRVAACTLSRSPYSVTRYPKASDISSPPCLFRLFPAGANRRVGLAPTEKRRLVMAHPLARTFAGTPARM